MGFCFSGGGGRERPGGQIQSPRFAGVPCAMAGPVRSGLPCGFDYTLTCRLTPEHRQSRTPLRVCWWTDRWPVSRLMPALQTSAGTEGGRIPSHSGGGGTPAAELKTHLASVFSRPSRTWAGSVGINLAADKEALSTPSTELRAQAMQRGVTGGTCEQPL